MELSIIILASAFVLLAWISLDYLEDRRVWTLRLRVALAYEYVIIPYSLLVLFFVVAQVWGMRAGFGLRNLISLFVLT